MTADPFCGCAPSCRMNPSPIKIGIIGGSGLDDPKILDGRKEVVLKTPFGPTSDSLIEGEIHGVKCYLLARHGRRHTINPSNINYRANIWALREVGCTHVLVTNACGSLRQDITPGDIMIPHDFIDVTRHRKLTFYDSSAEGPRGVLHMSMSTPFHADMRMTILAAAAELELKVHDKGVLVCIEGPRYSTRAESKMFRSWGGHVIGMTTVPEVSLAVEAGLIYGTVALVTDYDSWRDDEIVNTEDVMTTFKTNVEKVTDLLLHTIKKISERDWSQVIFEVKHSVMDSFVSQ